MMIVGVSRKNRKSLLTSNLSWAISPRRVGTPGTLCVEERRLHGRKRIAPRRQDNLAKLSLGKRPQTKNSTKMYVRPLLKWSCHSFHPPVLSSHIWIFSLSLSPFFSEFPEIIGVRMSLMGCILSSFDPLSNVERCCLVFQNLLC